jgi:hypothetical protein
MIITNPFTGMTLNAGHVPNPEGCNQHTGPDCAGNEREFFRSGDVNIPLGSYGSERAATRFHHPKRPIKRYAVDIKTPAQAEDDEGREFRDPHALARAILRGTRQDKNTGLPRTISEWGLILKKAGPGAGHEAIRKTLEEAGYDGIEYDNEVEDLNSRSVIPLSPSQVRELPFPHVG